MTAENKRQAIMEDLARADQSLEAAHLLARGGYYNDAVSRLYYFLYQTARALLISRDFEPRSHEGMLRLVVLHFVKAGVLTPKDSHILSRLMKYREEADYNASYVFTKQDFEELAQDAQRLHAEIVGILKREGYI